MIKPARLSPTDLEVDAWAEQLVRERLPRIRTLGEKWSATIATLTGLLGAGSVLSSDQAVRSLAPGWRVGYGALVVAALVAAVFATICAATVAQGGIVEIPPDIAGRHKLHDRLLQGGWRNLQRSRAATVVALILFAVAFAVRWYAPT